MKITERITHETTGLVECLTKKILKYNSSGGIEGNKEIEGTCFQIKSRAGIDEVRFPKIFSLPEIDALIGCNVKYKEVYHHFLEEKESLRGWNYKLEILEGPYKKWKLNEVVVVQF